MRGRRNTGARLIVWLRACRQRGAVRHATVCDPRNPVEELNCRGASITADTQSDELTNLWPSTPGQMIFAQHLEKELVHEVFHSRYYLCYAGFVVGSEQGVAVGHYDILTLVVVELGKLTGRK